MTQSFRFGISKYSIVINVPDKYNPGFNHFSVNIEQNGFRQYPASIRAYRYPEATPISRPKEQNLTYELRIFPLKASVEKMILKRMIPHTIKEISYVGDDLPFPNPLVGEC